MTIYDCFIYLPAKLETLFDIHKFSEDFFCKEASFKPFSVILHIQTGLFIIKESSRSTP